MRELVPCKLMCELMPSMLKRLCVNLCRVSLSLLVKCSFLISNKCVSVVSPLLLPHTEHIYVMGAEQHYSEAHLNSDG